jgi:anti-anti-sigma factor
LSGPRKSYCSHLEGYSVVTFPKELCKAPLDEIRETGEQVVSELANQKAPQCLVDLTALDYMGSSMVASIIRIWKAIEANQGRMVVAVSSIGVREVLRVTGLDRVWTIETSYDSALHELGFSSQAKIVKRELRLLAFVGPATFLVGGIAAALSRIPQFSELSQPPDWIAYSLIALAAITSGISIFREHSWRRWLSVIVFLIAATLLGWLIWTADPTDSDTSSPENGELVGSGDKQAESDESKKASNSPMQDTGKDESKEPSNTNQVEPQTSSPANTSDAAASVDDSAKSKPASEDLPANSSVNRPTSSSTSSDTRPEKNGTFTADPSQKPEGLNP